MLILLALAVVLSFALAGCKAPADDVVDETPATDDPATTPEDDTDEPVEEETIYNELGTWPVVKDEYKGQYGFTCLVAPEPWRYDFNAEDNYQTNYYEKLTNIDVEFQIIARDDMDEKINLMLAAGDGLPDAFMCSLGTSRLALYGAQGVFIALNEYIDTIAPGIEFLLSVQPAALEQLTFPDGNIYALGEFNECYHCDMAQRMWINSTWLGNLGIEAPVTTDEFAETLRKFKNDDPNQNGKQDEYPFVCPTDFWNGKLDGFMMNPFVVCNDTGSGNRLFLDNGTVKCSATQDGWKDALKYLKGLYDEGLIDAEFYATTQDNCRPLTMTEDGNLVGCAPGGYIGGFVDMATDVVYDYLWLDPLEGPTGLRQTPYYYTSVNMCYAITAEAEDPELCFRWGDMQNIFTKESQEGLHDNEENGLGIAYRLGEPGEYGLDGRAAADGHRLTRALLAYGEYNEGNEMYSGWGQPTPVACTNESRFQAVSPTDTWYLETELYKARTSYTPYGNQEAVIPLLLQTVEEAEALTEYSNVSTTISEWFAYFVTGEKDIDADWAEYIETLEAYGLNEIISIYQGCYDRVYGA
jgi:putative aldouronate transport system substrate-binding protein